MAGNEVSLADRYDAICDECMALAATWRKKIAESQSDKSFHAHQHRCAVLRAARFARMAEQQRQGMAILPATGWQSAA